MSIYIQLLLMSLLTVFVVDLSGWSDTVTDFASRVTGKRIHEVRPLTCSLCMTWWVTLGYSLAVHQFTLPVLAFCGLLAFASHTMGQTIIFIREAYLALLRWLTNLMNL